MRKIIGIVIVTLLITTVSLQVSACTGFTYSDDENVFACHNEDWSNYNFNIRFFSATDDSFGRMFFENQVTWGDGTDHMYPFSGMNDHGLFYSFYQTPYLKPINSTDKPIYYDSNMFPFLY